MKAEKFDDGVLCQLKIGRWGAKAKLNDEQIGDELPSEIVRVIQDLVEDKTIVRSLNSIRLQAKKALKESSLRFPIDNVYWIPKHKIENLDAEFTRLQTEYASEANNLAENITKLKDNFRRRYPKFYSAEKYPSADAIRAKHYFHWRFFQFQLPDKKGGLLTADMYKREQEKFQRMAKKMEEMAIDVIGTTLLKRIDKLREQCENDSVNAGTWKSLEKFMEKWNDIWAGNIDSDKMKSIMKQMRMMVSRTSSDKLKSDEDFRNQAAKKMEKIAKQVKAIPNFKLQRKLDI